MLKPIKKNNSRRGSNHWLLHKEKKKNDGDTAKIPGEEDGAPKKRKSWLPEKVVFQKSEKNCVNGEKKIKEVMLKRKSPGGEGNSVPPEKKEPPGKKREKVIKIKAHTKKAR